MKISVRQAITTKYRFGRWVGGVKATCDAGSLFLPWDHEFDPAVNHALAAQALAAKIEWFGRWVGGCTKDGYVFVLVDDSASFSVEAPKPARKVLTLDEIREAVKAGKTVHWSTTSYDVKLWSDGKFVVACPSTNYAIGLSYVRDGVEHVNARLEDFFLGSEA